MKVLKSFSEFLSEETVKRQTPNKSRAKSLLKESEDAYNFLTQVIKKFKITEQNANNLIKNSYDIIMELVRAKMLLRGFNSSGKGAHEAEVAYLRELNFSESEAQFLNQLRYFRNGILYYGKILDKEYAEKVFSFLKKIYPKLVKMCKEKLK